MAVLLFRVRSVSFHVFQRLVIAPQRGITTSVRPEISLFYLVKFFEKQTLMATIYLVTLLAVFFIDSGWLYQAVKKHVQNNHLLVTILSITYLQLQKIVGNSKLCVLELKVVEEFILVLWMRKLNFREIGDFFKYACPPQTEWRGG